MADSGPEGSELMKRVVFGVGDNARQFVDCRPAATNYSNLNVLARQRILI